MTDEKATAIAFEKDPVKRDAMIDNLTPEEIKDVLKRVLSVINFDEQRKARGEI